MTSPSIYVLQRPSFDQAAVARFLGVESKVWRATAGTTPAENLVEIAGRICYLSFGDHQSSRTNSEYLRNLIAQGHESVLEHVAWTFLLVGVSRAFTHQIVRHRVGFSFSQLSQQYHDESDAAAVRPAILDQAPTLRDVWTKSIEGSRQAYRQLLRRLEELGEVRGLDRREVNRLIRSVARGVLPSAVETKIVFTANARAIRHFLRIRGAILGDEEMRRVAALVLHEVQRDAPSLFSDFRIRQHDDGIPVVCHEELSH